LNNLELISTFFVISGFNKSLSSFLSLSSSSAKLVFTNLNSFSSFDKSKIFQLEFERDIIHKAEIAKVQICNILFFFIIIIFKF
jgi:hypothetical protein